MRADEERFALAPESGEEVRGRVAADLRAPGREPATHELPRLLLLGGQPETRHRCPASGDT